MTIRPVVAIDLGATKVACAIGLPNERTTGFELLGVSLVPYPTKPNAWLSDPLLVSRTIEEAVEATAVTGELDRAIVAINPTAAGSECASVAVPLGDEPVVVRLRDLERLQRRALDQVLGVDREPLLVERLGCSGNGFEGVRDPRGLSATRLLGSFHVVTMPMAARRAVVQAVEAAGLEVVRLSATLPAAFAGSTDETMRRRRLLLIDVGGLTTTIGFFIEGVLHASRHLPWGGLTLAEALAKALCVTLDQAVTWSLEGAACRRAEVRQQVTQAWTMMKEAAEQLMEGRPRPDTVLVTGRGALIDGCAEWIERATGISTTIGRSARLSRIGELARQVGLSSAIGLLELSAQRSTRLALRSPHPFNRLIERTRLILTDYF